MLETIVWVIIIVVLILIALSFLRGRGPRV